MKMDPNSNVVDGWIKAEPDMMDIPGSTNIDEDIYEDAGDLDFAAAAQDLYLMRIPKMLWENWSQLDDDQEIQIGTVRVEGDPNEVKRMSLLLDPNLAARATLPREYVLEITHPQAVNTFVFSEKDLPGYTSKLHRDPMSTAGSAGTQSHHPTHNGRENFVSQGIEKNRKSQGRRGIPKQTTIAGRIKKELKCLPVDNEDFGRIMDFRSRNGIKKKTTSFQKGLFNVAAKDAPNFSSFVKTSKPGKKSQKLKAARIPQNELLDQIFKCFQRFTYWSLKNLMHEIRQPEAYLKSTLEKVAQLIKSGHHSGLWQLRPEHKFDNVKLEQAPDVDSPRASDFEFDDADEEDVEMENVLQ